MSDFPVVLSMGLVSCADGGVDGAWKYLLDDTCKFSVQKKFESPVYGDKLFGNLDCPENKYSKLPICVRLARLALDEAINGFESFLFDGKYRVGIFCGTSIGSVIHSENALIAEGEADGNFTKYAPLASYEGAGIADNIAKFLKTDAMRMTHSTACSSSGLSFCAASKAIRNGEIDFAVVCGVDSLSRTTVNGFSSLQLLSKDKSRPFDARRDGINLGEGCGIILLCSDALSKKLGLKKFSDVLGWSCTSDAYHATAPHPEAEGVLRAIENSLSMANLSAADIDYYNAHGTGTNANDLSEAYAIKKIFPDGMDFSSYKAKFGHLLGGSGILNLILSIKALNENLLPHSYGFEEQDSAINISPLRQNKKADIKNFMSVSLGFGGNNSCIILGDRDTNAQSGNAQSKKNRFFLSSCGCVLGSKIGADEALDINKAEAICSKDSLLKDMSVLKKRRYAKLQQMALQSVSESLAGGLPCEARDVCVCFGSGLGMIDQTHTFVKSMLDSKEKDLLPTAFTNSVHNAISGSVGTHFGFKGLNSLVSARETSFELALWDAMRELDLGFSKAAIVGACDEYNPYIGKFLNNCAKFRKCGSALVESAVSYVLQTDKTEKSFAEVLDIKFMKAKASVQDEADCIKKFLADAKVDSGEIKSMIFGFRYNRWQENFQTDLAKELKANDFTFLEDSFGANYSISAFGLLMSLKKLGSGKYLQYTRSSGKSAAIMLFEIL